MKTNKRNRSVLVEEIKTVLAITMLPSMIIMLSSIPLANPLPL